MKTEKAIIRCEAVFSDDKSYRYLMSKVWDKNKPIATVISISPSTFCNVSCDTTTQLIQNNLQVLGYGGMELVNLIFKINVEAKKLKSIDTAIGELTDKFIIESAERTDITILAWGKLASVNKAFADRENAVIEILKPYSEKIQVISDSLNRKMLHPLTPSIRKGWFLSSIQNL